MAGARLLLAVEVALEDCAEAEVDALVFLGWLLECSNAKAPPPNPARTIIPKMTSNAWLGLWLTALT